MGAGSWGTAFGLVVCDSGHGVRLWARRPELAEVVNARHRNLDYLPEVELPRALVAVADPAEAMDGADFVVLAVPSQSLRANLRQWRLPPGGEGVSPAKGIVLGTGLRVSEGVGEGGGGGAGGAG